MLACARLLRKTSLPSNSKYKHMHTHWHMRARGCACTQTCTHLGVDDRESTDDACLGQHAPQAAQAVDDVAALAPQVLQAFVTSVRAHEPS